MSAQKATVISIVLSVTAIIFSAVSLWLRYCR
jgi:hypothetical protein